MIFAAGSMVLWDLGTLEQRGIWQREGETGPQYVDSAEDVDFIVGCGVLFRRQVFDRIGLLDGRFYLNYEDVDICITRSPGRLPGSLHAARGVVPQSVEFVGTGFGQEHLLYDPQCPAVLLDLLNGWRRWLAVTRIVVAIWAIPCVDAQASLSHHGPQQA
jgi:hypothetical protein